MVLLAYDVVDGADNLRNILSLRAAKTVPFVSSHHLELSSLHLLSEVIEVQLEFVLYLLSGKVAVGHHEALLRTGNGQQPGLEVPEKHLLL